MYRTDYCLIGERYDDDHHHLKDITCILYMYTHIYIYMYTHVYGHAKKANDPFLILAVFFLMFRRATLVPLTMHFAQPSTKTLKH